MESLGDKYKIKIGIVVMQFVSNGVFQSWIVSISIEIYYGIINNIF